MALRAPLRASALAVVVFPHGRAAICPLIWRQTCHCLPNGRPESLEERCGDCGPTGPAPASRIAVRPDETADRHNILALVHSQIGDYFNR